MKGTLRLRTCSAFASSWWRSLGYRSPSAPLESERLPRDPATGLSPHCRAGSARGEHRGPLEHHSARCSLRRLSRRLTLAASPAVNTNARGELPGRVLWLRGNVRVGMRGRAWTGALLSEGRPARSTETRQQDYSPRPTEARPRSVRGKRVFDRSAQSHLYRRRRVSSIDVSRSTTSSARVNSGLNSMAPPAFSRPNSGEESNIRLVDRQ